MDTELADDLVVWLKRARRAPKPLYWFFCFKGHDGEPVLMVGKKPGEIKKRGREQRKQAKDKKFCFGRVQRNEDNILVFGIEDGTAPVKLVEKAFKLRLANSDDLKQIRPLLKKASIVEAGAFEEAVGVPDTPDGEETTDPAPLKGQAEKVRDAAKKAIEAAKKRAGNDGFGAAPQSRILNKVGKDGAAAMKGEDYEEAIDLFAAIVELAESIGRPLPPEEDDGEPEDAWLDDSLDVSDADPNQLAALWIDTLGQVDAQLSMLVKFLKAKSKTVPPEQAEALKEIGQKGLGALTVRFRVPLQAALLEAKVSSGEAQDKALVRAVSLANKFVDFVYDDARFEACDRLDLGGKRMTLRKTLGGALRQIADAG